MTNIREELAQKLDKLSTEQLNSVRQFVEFLEYKQQPVTSETPLTNEDIDRIVESYRKQNKQRPIGLAQGEFVVPDDFNDPLPNVVSQLTEEPEIANGVRQPGSAIGTLKIVVDDDVHLEDFMEYMP
ncbi:MAG: DUF2281 domain-containing protein [Cyanobacteria bacterium P01_F01_bin.143]